MDLKVQGYGSNWVSSGEDISTDAIQDSSDGARGQKISPAKKPEHRERTVLRLFFNLFLLNAIPNLNINILRAWLPTHKLSHNRS